MLYSVEVIKTGSAEKQKKCLYSYYRSSTSNNLFWRLFGWIYIKGMLPSCFLLTISWLFFFLSDMQLFECKLSLQLPLWTLKESCKFLVSLVTYSRFIRWVMRMNSELLFSMRNLLNYPWRKDLRFLLGFTLNE